MRAALFVLALAACGDGTTLPDADPRSDADARGLVTVRIEKATATTGVRVFFQNADSTLVLATRFNDANEASALMAPGGFVTVYEEPFAEISLYTWTNVQPGDVLTLDLRQPELGDAQPNLSLIIEAFDNALDYFAFDRCESFVEVSAALESPFAPFFQSCTPTSDVLLVARDQNAEPAGYRYAKNANLQSPGTLDMRGPYTPFDATVDVEGPTGAIVNVTGALADVFYTTGTSTQITGTHATLPISMPVIAGEVAQLSARMIDDTNDPRTVVSAIVWGPGTTSTTLDLSAPIRTLTTRPELDLSSYELRWTENDDGERGDLVWAQVGFSNLQWIVIGERRDETTLRLPVLPYEALRPRDETVYVDTFALIDTDVPYDRLHTYLLGRWSPSNGSLWPMVDPTGRVSFRSTR